MDTEEDDQSGIMETIPESDAPEEVASDPKRSGFVTAPQGAFPGEDGTQQDEKNPITDEKANHGSVSFHIDTLEASWDGSAEETSGTIHQAVPSVEVDASAYPNNRFKKGRDATVEVRESVPPEQGHATQDHQRHPSSDAYPTTYPAHYLNPAAIFPVTVKKSLDHLLDPLEASIHPPLHHTPSSILPAAQVSPFKLPPTQPKRVLLKAREFVIGEARSRTPVYTGEDGGLDPETEAAWMAKIAADEDAALLAYARKHANEDFAEKVRAVVERHRRGILVPYMLDGVSMLKKAKVENPMDVFILDVTNNSLRFVVPEELALFVNIHTFRAGENLLPFAKLGALPNLRRLYLPFNEISDMDLEVDGLFSLLEHLDLSYNHITSAALIVLATLPSLKHLDLSANKIPTLPLHLISDMAHWRERVIELLLPNHVALLDATLQQEFGKDWAPERLSAPPTRANTVHEAMRVFAERTGSPPMSAPDVAARLSAAAAAVAAQRDAGETIMEDEDDVIVDVHLEERDLRVDTHHGLRPWGEEEDSVDRTMAKVPVPPEGLRRSDSPRRRSAGEGKDAAGGEGRGGEDNEVGMPMPLRVTGAPIAFEVLETLVLERNALFSDESFLILGRLPLLKRLNLNYNRFRSLVFLSDHQKGNDISESPPPPFLVKKYDGFPKLEELRVAFNKIDSVRGLLAVVWLPVLKFIWLEGNPVLIKFGKVASQAKETLYQKSLPDIVSYAECDPLKLLPRVYGIEILDLIYQPHPSVLEGTYYALAPVKKTGSVALRRIVRTNHHIHSQVVAPAALPESEDSLQPLPPYSTTVLVHEVEDVIQPRPEELKERRREFKLTDEEVKETVRAGRVLTLKELKRLRRREEQEARALDKRREMERRMYEEELQRERTKMEELLAMQKLQMEQQQENEQQQNQRSKGQQQEGLSQTETSVMSGIGVDIKFDPTVQDRTFLTSVHITGGSGEMTTTILSVPQLLEPKDQSNDVPDGQWPNDETEEKYTQQQQEVEETFSLLESFQESSNSFSTLDNTEDSYNPPRRISTRLYHHLNSKHILPTAARAAERRKELARNHQFPKSIQSSIRALRHALTNPISYWRVVEDSYAKPTFAHTVRVKDAAAEAAAARKAKMEAEGRYYRPETEPKDYDDFMGDPMVFEGGVNQQGLKPPMSPARSETSSAVDANLIPESGNISPANTMWTTAAVKFNAEREAAIAAANRAAKNVVATAKIAITTAVKVEVPREKGVFIEEDALELAQKLGKEQLRKRIILMNDEDENEANGSLDKSQPSQPSTQSEKSSSLAQQEKGKSELLKRLEREKLEEEDARRRLQEEGLMGGLDFKRPDSDYRFSAVQRQHMNKTPAGAATLAALRAAEYKRKLNEKKKQEAKKIKTKDEFEEMKEIMTLMDSKITTIEANLASVLKSNIMQKHVPQSRKLIDEVQAEYKRIEKMYHESAMAAIEASKLKSK